MDGMRLDSVHRPPSAPPTEPNQALIPHCFDKNLIRMVVERYKVDLKLDDFELEPEDVVEMIMILMIEDPELVDDDVVALCNQVLERCSHATPVYPIGDDAVFEDICSAHEMWLEDNDRFDLRSGLHERVEELEQYMLRRRWQLPLSQPASLPRLTYAHVKPIVSIANDFLKFVEDGMNGQSFVNFVVRAPFTSPSPWPNQWSDFKYNSARLSSSTYHDLYTRMTSSENFEPPYICLLDVNESRDTVSFHFVTENEYTNSFLPEEYPIKDASEYLLSQTRVSNLIWLCALGGRNQPSAYLGYGGRRMGLWSGRQLLRVLELCGCECGSRMYGELGPNVELGRTPKLDEVWEAFLRPSVRRDSPFQPRPEEDVESIPSPIPPHVEAIVRMKGANLKMEFIGNVYEFFEYKKFKDGEKFISEHQADFVKRVNALQDVFDGSSLPRGAQLVNGFRSTYNYQQAPIDLFMSLFRYRASGRSWSHFAQSVATFPNVTSVAVITDQFMEFVRDGMGGKPCVNFFIKTRYWGQAADGVWSEFRNAFSFACLGSLRRDFGCSWKNLYNVIVADPQWAEPCICLIEIGYTGTRRNIVDEEIYVHFLTPSEFKNPIHVNPNGETKTFCFNDAATVVGQTNKEFVWLYGIDPPESPYEDDVGYRLPVQAYLGYGGRRTRLQSGAHLLDILGRYTATVRKDLGVHPEKAAIVESRNVHMDMSDIECDWGFWGKYLTLPCTLRV